MIDPKTPILVAHEDGRHWHQLYVAADIRKVLSGQMLMPSGETIETRMEIVGVPTIIDVAGRVWPRPDKGWSLWRAEPIEWK